MGEDAYMHKTNHERVITFSKRNKLSHQAYIKHWNCQSLGRSKTCNGWPSENLKRINSMDRLIFNNMESPTK